MQFSIDASVMSTESGHNRSIKVILTIHRVGIINVCRGGNTINGVSLTRNGLTDMHHILFLHGKMYTMFSYTGK